MSVTFALTTAAPLGSLTVPRMRPPVLCAAMIGANASAAIAKIERKDKQETRNASAFRRVTSDFMRSPLKCGAATPTQDPRHDCFQKFLKNHGDSSLLRDMNLTIIPQT